MRTYEFDVDIMQPWTRTIIETVVYDYLTTKFIITLKDGEADYDIEDKDVEIAFGKPDGTVVVQDKTSGVTVVDGDIHCLLSANATAAVGKVFAEIRVLDEQSIITSAYFLFYARRPIVTDEDIESTTDFPILANLIVKNANIHADEELRITAEEEREANEAIRIISENARSTAEDVRIANESSRVSAEDIRIANESSRIADEDTRILAEAARSTAEDQRVTAESNRVIAEASRTTAEDQRVVAEAGRSTAEDQRVVAEAARSTAEGVRDANETARISAESGRSTAEDIRVANESSRIAAEDIRIANESSRITFETARRFFAAWTSTVEYSEGNKVSYEGRSYWAVQDNDNVEPGTDPANWLLMADKGAAGTIDETTLTSFNGIVGGDGANMKEIRIDDVDESKEYQIVGFKIEDGIFSIGYEEVT